jgi:hypothetical protein
VIYEYRAYTCFPGRLPALVDRFESVTFAFWETYGIRHAGFWTTEIGESNQVLHYLLEWESMAEREQKWSAFQADTAWNAARAATETPDKIVASVKNEFWRSVDRLNLPRG